MATNIMSLKSVWNMRAGPKRKKERGKTREIEEERTEGGGSREEGRDE